MKLNNEDGEKEKDYSWVLSIFDVLIIIALVFAADYSYKKFISVFKNDPTEEIYTEATILDVERYIDDDGIFRYYMEVKTSVYGEYTIDITKGDFIHYKTKDIVEIKIKNNTAYILKNDE